MSWRENPPLIHVTSCDAFTGNYYILKMSNDGAFFSSLPILRAGQSIDVVKLIITRGWAGSGFSESSKQFYFPFSEKITVPHLEIPIIPIAYKFVGEVMYSLSESQSILRNVVCIAGMLPARKHPRRHGGQ